MHATPPIPQQLSCPLISYHSAGIKINTQRIDIFRQNPKVGLLPFFNFKNVTITLASKCARNCPNYIVTEGNRAVIKFIKMHFREFLEHENFYHSVA